MKSNSRSLGSKFIAILLLLTMLATSLADITLGKKSFDYAAAKPLKTTIPLNVNLGRAPAMRFVGRVGGVAFDSLARPEKEGDGPKSIELFYDPAQPDGKRLLLKLDGEETTTDIYDWELIPIVQYANSNSTSCFTLFGELEDADRQSREQEAGSRVLNYDEAFIDTLLGFRMFQLDVLVLDTDFAIELPMEDGEYILGTGEDEPKDGAGLALFAYQNRVQTLVREAERENFPSDFQSYVICDYGTTVGFSVNDGALELSGEPFYYFWKSGEGGAPSRQNMIIAELIDSGLMREGESLDEFLERKSREVAGSRNPLLEQTRFELAVDRAVAEADKKYEQLVEGGQLKGVYLEEYSKRHKELVPLLAQMNPAVWNAGRKTMRYSAFFRYCKKHHGENWRKFVVALKAASPKVEPELRTPTILNAD